MIKRLIQPVLEQRLSESPAVALIGPRQIGKTTLALDIAEHRPSVYIDLESDSQRAKLFDPEAYLSEYEDRLVILDEVHRLPNIFQPLRGLIDRGRRKGKENGRFLLLGSASIDLLKQSGETLAGRISYIELSELNTLEVPGNAIDSLWVRGGFPKSFLSNTDKASLRWRLDFIQTYLEREIQQFGPRIPAETLRRFWTMLAHNQGGLLNAAQLARNLGVDGKTIANYLDLLVDLLLVRRLPPWHTNRGKRLIRSPKVYVRDSGLVHALLKIADKERLLEHPIIGQSWEGFVIETLLSVAPEDTEAAFYRTSAGAEIDLVLEFLDGERWAIEIKRGTRPKVERGFHIGCEDLKVSNRFVVYQGTETFPLGNDTKAIGVRNLARLIQKR
jgi:predicted AAA+ superfamily ATPase